MKPMGSAFDAAHLEVGAGEDGPPELLELGEDVGESARGCTVRL